MAVTVEQLWKWAFKIQETLVYANDVKYAEGIVAVPFCCML